MADKGTTDRQQEIIDTAFQLIAEKGFEGLRVREVAERVEINNATLHYYFPKKDDLIEAVVRMIIDLIRDSIISEEATDSPRERLRSHIEAHFYQLEQYPLRMRVLTEISMRAKRHERLQQVLTELDSEWQRVLTGILSEGITAGDFMEDLDVTAAVDMIMNLFRGIALVHPDNRAADNQDIDGTN